MTTQYFVDIHGNYKGTWTGSVPSGDFISVPNPPADARQIWLFGSQIWTSVPPVSRVPTLVAMADIFIQDWEISGIETSSGLSGAFQFDIGKYWFFFEKDLGDTLYIPLAYNGGAVRCYVDQADKFTDSFIITVVDNDGNAADTNHLSVEIKRII